MQSSPDGKDSPPRILAVGFVCSLVSRAPSPFPIDRAQSWSSTHHPGWKICLRPVPLPTLPGGLNAPLNGERNAPFVPGQSQQDYLLCTNTEVMPRHTSPLRGPGFLTTLQWPLAGLKGPNPSS